MFLLIITILIMKFYDTHQFFSTCLFLFSLMAILIFSLSVKYLPLPSSEISKTETACIQTLSKTDYEGEQSYVWIEDSKIKHLPEARTIIVYSDETTVTTIHEDYPFWLDCMLFPLNFSRGDTYIISIPKEAIL